MLVASRNSDSELLDELSANHDPLLVYNVFDTSTNLASLSLYLLPQGWINQNKALCLTLDEMAATIFNTTNRTIAPLAAQHLNEAVDRAFANKSPYNFVAAMMIPNCTKSLARTARNQTWLDQARIVVAMERFRLASHTLPTSLTNLVPAYLPQIPRDVFTGLPMNYQLRADQSILLWSVGWNVMDEGGYISQTSDGKEDPENGDWVWHYPMN